MEKEELKRRFRNGAVPVQEDYWELIDMAQGSGGDEPAGGGLPDAPADGKTYGRTRGQWTEVVGEAPQDGGAYVRRDGAWVKYGSDGAQVYGVRHYYKNQSPTLLRFQESQGADLHQLQPVQSLMRRCILTDSGEVAYYLDPKDSTKKEDGSPARLDGSDGMVMVEIPEHYRRHRDVVNEQEPTLSYYETAISLFPFPGAFRVNRCYVSAYEATVDRDKDNKLASVASADPRYRGGGNQADWDGTYRSMLGKPASGYTLASDRSHARARGAGWSCYEWDIHCTIYWLFAVEYATLNSQAAYSAARNVYGYPSGGLGEGVTTIHNTAWGNFGRYAIVPCGVTNTAGDATAVVNYDVDNGTLTGGVLTVAVPSYRGIENPFGHLAKNTDGLIAQYDSAANQYDCYVCRDRSRYSSEINDAYIKIGSAPAGKSNGTASGYIAAIIRDQYGDMIVVGLGGSNAAYYCDQYLGGSVPTVKALTGGAATFGGASKDMGLSYLRLYDGIDTQGSYHGTRLCWCERDRIIESA